MTPLEWVLYLIALAVFSYIGTILGKAQAKVKNLEAEVERLQDELRQTELAVDQACRLGQISFLAFDGSECDEDEAYFLYSGKIEDNRWEMIADCPALYEYFLRWNERRYQ